MADTNPNRRRILAGTAVALSAPVAALPAVAAVTATAGRDATLLALCRSYGPARDALNATPDDIPDEELDAMCDGLRAIEREIAAIPARTLAGLDAKARLFVRACEGCMIDPD